MKHTVIWKPPQGIDSKHDTCKKYVKSFCVETLDKLKEFVDNYDAKCNQYKKELEIQIRKYSRQEVTMVQQSQGRRGSKVLGQVKESDFQLSKETLQQLQVELKRIENDSTDSDQIQQYLLLYEEILQHLHIAKIKMRFFTGRSEHLHKVDQYLNDNGNMPLVVHGLSGSGKTSFVAAVAHRILQSKKNYVVMLRFVGSTVESSDFKHLLSSLCRHVCLAYQFEIDEKRLLHQKKAFRYFKCLMDVVSTKFGSKRPLVILLDSLDTVMGSNMSLMTSLLPKFIHLIVSIREEKQCFRMLQSVKKSKPNVLQIGSLVKEEFSDLVDTFCREKQRKLTASQRQVIMGQIADCSEPLYVTLLLEAATFWKSFDDISYQVIPGTVYEAISNMFTNLEMKYGKKFVEATLGYITLCKDGISDIELENVLSMNDSVLDEVYKYHNPPIQGIVTIPPLMFARIKFDLKEYLSERIVFGQPKWYWSYQHFQEAACNKYASDKIKKELHLQLADLFLVEQSYKRSVNLTQRNLVVQDADRQVLLQPLLPSNKRKLSALFHHLKEVGDVDQLKTHTICNSYFLECFTTAFGANELLEIIDLVAKAHSDYEVEEIARMLRFENLNISVNPNLVHVQLLCHFYERRMFCPGIERLCQSAEIRLQQKQTCILPINNCIGISQNELRWYKTDVQNLLPCFSSDYILAAKSNTLISVNNRTNQVCQLRCDEHKISTKNVKISSSGKLVFILFSDVFIVYSITTGNQIGTFSNRAQSSENLNIAMCVREDLSSLVLASVSRLGKFDNVSTSYGEYDYKPTKAMSLSGAQNTFDLEFCEESTISTHEIKTKSGLLGAVILWNHDEQKLTCKVGLPSIPIVNFLHRLKNTTLVICGCQNGQILLIDIEIGKIVNDFGTKETGSKLKYFLNAFDSSKCLLVAVMPDKNIISWDLTGQTPIKLKSHKITNLCKSLSMNGDFCTAVLTLSEGCIGCFNVISGKMTTTKIERDEVKSVVCTDNDMLFTLGEKNVLKQWDLELLLNSETTGPDTSESEYDENDVTCAAFSTDSKYLFTGTF